MLVPPASAARERRGTLDVSAQPPGSGSAHLRDQVRLTLVNDGRHRRGCRRGSGATRSFETLEPGARQEMTLPLSANPKTVIVAQLGPWAQRRIEVPIPQTRTTFRPPEVVIGEQPSIPDGAHRRRPARGWISSTVRRRSSTSPARARAGSSCRWAAANTTWSQRSRPPTVSP
jgi:hypothetical protein